MTTDNLPARTINEDQLDRFDVNDVELFLGLLTGEVRVVESDSDHASREMLARTLNAADEDAVLGELGELMGSDKLVGVPMTIEGFEVRPSRLGDGGIYLLVHAANLKTGEALDFSTSARTICAQLARLAQLNAFPVICKIKESNKETKNGYRPLSLVRITDDGK